MDASRQRFRQHALDGAALYFQPSTGLHVRVETAATAGLRRSAPRVAMFGITNACNLACAFCSRDPARPSQWTVATAAAALRGLHDAGTLEVAYGGGEPFAFRGFAELVAELDATTALAQHVTTNGTLIHGAGFAPYAGRFGQVRVSIYDDGWRPAAETLAGHGQRWGANLIIDRAALAGLPAHLAALAARGCHDVSLLSYVGPERARHLSDADAAELAAIIADSPVACRLSVCFGARVAAPRLVAGADCGAGLDFLTITPDRRVQSCSFQDASFPGATADEILAAWRDQQRALAGPSPRAGCARALPRATVAPAPPIAVWRAFSGNNSGECVLVARFTRVADAEAFLAELAPSWPGEGEYPPAWRELFVAEGLTASAAATDGWEGAPRELAAIGRSVIALGYAADDAFPELRALAWKRGAAVSPGGIHVHGDVSLLAAIRTASVADRDRRAAAPSHPAVRRYLHGDLLLAVLPLSGDGAPGSLVEAGDVLAALAGDRPFAVEALFDVVDDQALLAAKQHLGHRPPLLGGLWVSFFGEDRLAKVSSFARSLGDARTSCAGGAVWIEPAPDRKRLAVLVCRRGGHAMALDGPRLVVTGSLWRDAPRGQPRPTYDVAAIEAAIASGVARGTELTVTAPRPRSWGGVEVKLVTDAPGAALSALDRAAAAIDAQLGVWVHELDPVGAALRRVVEDVGG